MAVSLASLGLKAGHHGQGSPLHSTVGWIVVFPAPPHSPDPQTQPASCCRDTIHFFSLMALLSYQA